MYKVRYIAFNKSEVTDNATDSFYRYKVPLPEDAKDGDLVEVQLKDALPMSAKDFMYELESDLDRHPGNMLDPRALLLVLLFFGPFGIISYQTTMFGYDLGVRGPDSVKGGDLFKLWREEDYLWGASNVAEAVPDHMKDRYWGGDQGAPIGSATVFDRLRGDNPTRDRWEREIALKWREGDPSRPLWDEPYKGDRRSLLQRSNDHCPALELASFTTTVTPVDTDGNELESFASDASIYGTYCLRNGFFLLLIFIVPFILIGGFLHMTLGWRQDLKHYVRTAVKREMSDAAKAVHIDEATRGDRFGGECCQFF